MIRLLVVCLLFAQFPLAAQSIYSSPYAIYGPGMIHGRASSFNKALGGTGIGLQDDLNLNNLNPASYASIAPPASHLYEVGLYIESNRLSTSSRRESKTAGGLTNLNYWFKFNRWWAAAAGLSPFSSVDYRITTQRDLGSGSTVNYTYDGSGNINRLYLGNAFTITKNLSVGVTVSYLFGSITRRESIDLSSEISLLTLDNKLYARKLDVDAGIQYKFRFGKRSLVLGLVADDGMTLNGEQDLALYDQYADTLANMEGDDVAYKLPSSFGLGASVQSKRYTIAADLRYEPWRQARYSDQDLIFQDTWRFSGGISYKGNPDATSYLGAIGWRAGFYGQQYQLKIKNTSFPLWGVSAGISLPMFDGKSSVNLTYTLDQLGTTMNGLILQRSQKLSLDLVIRDLWGVRRKFD